MIKARGIKDGETVEVIFENGKATYNGKQNAFLDEELDWQLAMQYAVGGTYFPARDSLLNVYNVLENHFFERLMSIETDGEIPTMDFEKGRVY